jgi:hypothetical protein
MESWRAVRIKHLIVTLRHVVLVFHGLGVATGSTLSYASGSAASFYVFSGEGGTRKSDGATIRGKGVIREFICTFLDLFTNVNWILV